MIPVPRELCDDQGGNQFLGVRIPWRPNRRSSSSKQKAGSDSPPAHMPFADYCTVKTAAGLTILPDVAVMFVVWPLVPMTDASPPESMVATVVLLEVHVTEAVMSDV